MSNKFSSLEIIGFVTVFVVFAVVVYGKLVILFS